MKNEITTLRTIYGNLITCNDCGACADGGRSIKHHDTCIPGEGKRWENFNKYLDLEEPVHE